jgi:glycosyltransferase involved in cell wall biosynthesis
MTKRICFVRQSIYPEELSVRREVETVHRAGFETHVISLAAPSGARSGRGPEIIDGVHVHRLPLRRQKSHLGRYLYDYAAFTVAAALRLTGLHLRHPFDAIQVNTMPDFLVFATLLPKLLGAKVAVMMQEPVPELWETLRETPAPKLLRLAEQWALAYADAAFTVTQQLKEAYVARGAAADKITVILNVPESRFLLDQAPLSGGAPDPSHFTLICHGAIEERYGQDTLLQAVAALRESLPCLRLRITGDGRYREAFLAQRDALGLQAQVAYLGYVSLAQLADELRCADVGVVAQKASVYSHLVHTNKMYDFLAFGKPVIASRLRSVSAYFDEASLAYFTPGNPQDLARVILDLYQHPEKRQALVANSQALYARYRWENQKENYLSMYRKWLR